MAKTNTKPAHTLTHWRSQPRQRINDMLNQASPATYPVGQVADVRRHKPLMPILDLSPRTAPADFPYLSPVVEAKRSHQLWNSFKISTTTSTLPYVELASAITAPRILDKKDASLPLEKPHAIALGLAVLLIALGILSFKI